MSDTNTRLWSRDGFVTDRFVHAEGLDGVGNHDGVILPLQTFLALDRASFADEKPIGVSVAPGEAIEPLLPRLDQIAVVALSFPAFSDGRSSSKAAVLRGHHHFAGELRAFGDILIDQVPFLLRCGFDTLEVSHPVTIQRLADGISFDPRLYYQPGTGSAPAERGFSWRRVPAT